MTVATPDRAVTARTAGARARLADLWAGLGLLLLWAALFLPAAATRGLHYEEGRRAFAAFDMLTHGHWLAPQVLGVDYLAKPPLLPWVIAAVGGLGGVVDAWAVRALPLMATAAMAAAAYLLARRYAGPLIAFIAGAATLTMPMILEKGAVGETDTTVTAAVFAAFILWWRGAEAGRVRPGHAAGAAILLAVAGLTKGPIPLGFFAAGALGLMVRDRRWADLPRLLLVLMAGLAPLGLWAWAVFEPGTAEMWRGEMRLDPHAAGVGAYLLDRGEYLAELVAVLLPWLPAAGAAVYLAYRRGTGPAGPIAALLLYALPFGLLVSLSPQAAPRYLMPAVPAVAVLAALGIGALLHHPRVRQATAVAIAGLAAAQIGAGTGVIPFRAALYGYAEAAGSQLGRAIRGSDDPVILLAPTVDFNVLYYSGQTPRHLLPAQSADLPIPSWVITVPAVLEALEPETVARLAAPVLTVDGRRGAPIHLHRVTTPGR